MPESEAVAEDEEAILSPYGLEEASIQELFYHLDGYLLGLIARGEDMGAVCSLVAAEPTVEIEADLRPKAAADLPVHQRYVEQALDAHGITDADRERLWLCACLALSNDIHGFYGSRVLEAV